MSPAASPRSKVVDLRTAVDSIPQGATLSFGGFGHFGHPLAFVRELLRAEFIEEQTLAPRDAPVTFDSADGADVAPADVGSADSVPPEDIPPVPDEDR